MVRCDLTGHRHTHHLGALDHFDLTHKHCVDSHTTHLNNILLCKIITEITRLDRDRGSQE